MAQTLSKAYDPKTVEFAVAARWESQGYSNPDRLPERHKKPFVVMMPLPNVTGTLHMGHALEDSLTDCLIRFKRMKGYRALYLPGLDHAGIATQNAVEKLLKKEGKIRFDLGREEFVKRVWQWKEEYGGKILEQLRRLGISADWSRERFTMDERYSAAVTKAFHHYYEKGLIYKGERVINWCPRCATSLSDLELEYSEPVDEFLYELKYPIEGSSDSIHVATARPETMLGDAAVAVHPQDARWRRFVGKSARVPIANRTIPIVADDSVQMDFGTGAVKVTPAHDLSDAAIGERHDLPFLKIINEKGRLTDAVPEKYRGLKTKEAREEILKDLRDNHVIAREDAYTHNLAICYRCNTVVEPMPSKQWFLKMSELAKPAADAYRNGKIIFTPERWLRVALERLANERDWCISRQLWWGHKIPLEGEEDVLDTWFSSALWPFVTLGWPDKTKDLETFYPTQWMTSARDILFLWINRMVFSGLELIGDIPFREVCIHPTVLTKDGKRMSKSLGTGIDPVDLIEKYGADAVRFGLLWQMTGTQDIRFDESAIIAGKKFLNKLWNATRFVLSQTEGVTIPEQEPQPQTDEDREILTHLQAALVTIGREIEALRFGQALEGFYNFFWHEFCDRYLEHAKKRDDQAANAVLLWVTSSSLRALHPFIPHITDELWEKLPHAAPVPLMIAEWPR